MKQHTEHSVMDPTSFAVKIVILLLWFWLFGLTLLAGTPPTLN
jgi:hypothetical protein